MLAFAADQPGDFDGSGTLNANDIDLISHATRLSLEIPILDLTGDGKFDLEDRGFWIEDLANTFLGIPIELRPCPDQVSDCPADRTIKTFVSGASINSRTRSKTPT